MLQNISGEVVYKTARSGGKSGQNVNKVETAVEATWHVVDSRLFSSEEKELIVERLKNRISKDGFLIVKSTETRSQLENKAIALEKMQELIARSLVQRKKRKPTKPSKASVEKRLFSKRVDGLKKRTRRTGDAGE